MFRVSAAGWERRGRWSEGLLDQWGRIRPAPERTVKGNGMSIGKSSNV